MLHGMIRAIAMLRSMITRQWPNLRYLTGARHMPRARISYIPAVPCCSKIHALLPSSRRRLVSEVVEKPHQWFAWFASAALICGSMLASFDCYPWYSIAFMIANSSWIIVGVLWREKSLIVMNAVITVIYILGLIFK